MENSKIKLTNYQVDEIKFNINPNWETNKTVKLAPQFSWGRALNDENDHELLALECELFKDVEDPPFWCFVKITGEFEISDGIDRDSLQHPMLSFLIPYMRALISQVTAVAQVKPVTLPIIDIDVILAAATPVNEESGQL
jgi:preprotein translocase subunit SecB